jgi:hypothetical protein
MRGKHQLHTHQRDRIGQRVGRDAGAAQPPKRLGARSTLGAAVRIAGMVSPPMNAVVLFGNVGERQKMRERPRHGQRRIDGHLSQQSIEALELGIAAAGIFRRFAHTFDPLENLIAFVMTQHSSEQLAKETHVITQRLMRIVTHPAILLDHRAEARRARGPKTIAHRPIRSLKIEW